MDDETVPYRSHFPGPGSVMEDRKATTDEANYDTLKSVYLDLKAKVDELDKWSAFDTTEAELKLKQQIVAHRMAYDILAPLLETVRSTLATIDSKYKEK